MEEEEKQEQEWTEKLDEGLKKHINRILTDGITSNNLMTLGQLVDMQKDLKNIEYWEVKEMMYRDGGYRGRGNYRGYPMNDYDYRGGRSRDSMGRYKGEDMLDDMRENYGTYMEGSRGRYSGESDKAFDYMLKSAKEFFMHLFEESQSPEQEEKIRRTAREISEM